MARKGDPPAADSASRTLVLGIDESGLILQSGHNAQGVLGREPGELLGTHLSELVEEAKDRLEQLLDAVRAGQEHRAVLSMLAAGGQPTDAVVTAHPMAGAGNGPAALVYIRVALPPSQRFQDPGLMRRALLDDPLTRFGATLDLDQTAKALVDVIVPHFCTTAALVVLESLVAADEVHGDPAGGHGGAVLRRLALATDDGNAGWGATFPVGEVLVYPKDTPYRKCLETAEPVHLPVMDTELARKVARKWRRKPAAKLFEGTSMVLLPVIAKDTLLGMLACARVPGYRRFDRYDVEMGMEFASRAAIVLDNARRFSRERATALTLQRSLLPTSLSAPSTVEVRHRYLPGSQLVEVGGDWYESIALPGARVALIVGDVAGHGVKAAVTMGRLRTALHTLAMLELPPAEALAVMHELMVELGVQEPHFATCVYAVYDAVSGAIEIASAGHLPPLLVHPSGVGDLLEIPPAPPLGVEGGLNIESRQFEVEDGSLFVIYTDGLVESRGRDIDDGLERLRCLFDSSVVDRPMEDLAKATLDSVYADEHRDDIAVLLARLRRLPDDQWVSWTLPADPAAVRRARGLVRDQLDKWDLSDLSYTTELLTSELITNALRYAPGPIEIRMLRERTLICEVLDRSAALPRLRHAGDEEENGRGLVVIGQLAHRWGARRTAEGKVVWCEQVIPGVDPSPAVPSQGWPGEAHHLSPEWPSG